MRCSRIALDRGSFTITNRSSSAVEAVSSGIRCSSLVLGQVSKRPIGSPAIFLTGKSVVAREHCGCSQVFGAEMESMGWWPGWVPAWDVGHPGIVFFLRSPITFRLRQQYGSPAHNASCCSQCGLSWNADSCAPQLRSPRKRRLTSTQRWLRERRREATTNSRSRSSEACRSSTPRLPNCGRSHLVASIHLLFVYFPRMWGRKGQPPLRCPASM